MEKPLDLLNQAGLSKSEAKVYVKLLERGTSRASELAIASGVPRQNVYIIMESLMDKGFCIIKPGKVKKYASVDPEVALTHYAERLEDKKNKQQAALKELSSQLRQMNHKVSASIRPLEYIEIMSGKSAAVQKFNTIAGNVKHEILEFVKAPYANPSVLYEQEIAAIKRGIKAYFLLEMGEWESKRKHVILQKMQKAGVQVRLLEQLPLKLVVFDGDSVMFNFPDPLKDGSLTTMMIYHEDFASMMRETFWHYWNNASP